VSEYHVSERVKSKYKLSSGLSVYLDLLRFLAAFAVFIFHAGHFAQFKIPFFGGFGSQGVIVFFVLSGLVIAYSADAKHTDLIDFSLARLARLWSVVLPALALTFVLDTIGQYMALASYLPMQPYTPFKWVVSLMANALFLNQIWGFSIWPGTNGPFWSLSYEFWYYAIFAAGFYFKGLKRVAIVATAMFLAGPGILTALPVWGMGVVVYMVLKSAGAPSLGRGLVIWCLSFAAAGGYTLIGGHDLLVQMTPITSNLVSKEWAINFWPESCVLGTIIGFNIYGFAGVSNYASDLFSKYASVVRSVADTSFGLYLFHYPLMYFVKALLTVFGMSGGWTFAAIIYIVPFGASVMLALKCETYKRSLTKLLKSFASKVGYKRSELGVTDVELAVNIPALETSQRL
jgi:peptidoglycan/LPS O-acetylase OafA/YrhL